MRARPEAGRMVRKTRVEGPRGPPAMPADGTMRYAAALRPPAASVQGTAPMRTIAAFFLCFAASCSLLGNELGLHDGDEIAFKPLVRGHQSGIAATTVLVARDDAQWREIWNQHVSRELPPPQAPAVDFAQDMVVCVCIGNRPTAGWSVKVERAVKEHDTLWLDVREKAPDSDALVAQMLTNPFEMVLLPQSDLRVDVRSTR